jgi:hypothetical protein
VSAFHTQVRLFGYDFQDSQFTVNLAAGITSANVGAAMTQDTTAANQFKLAGAGDPIHAILNVVEVRTVEGTLVGQVSFQFADKLTIDTGLSGQHVVAVGSRLEGSTAGTVRAIDMTTATPTIAQAAHAAAAPLVTELYSSTIAVGLKCGLI